MDGITEESPLAPVLLLWDYTERLLEVLGLQPILVWISMHTFLFGIRRDLIVALGLWCYLNHGTVKHVVLRACAPKRILAMLFVALATLLTRTSSSLMLSPRRRQSEALWPAPAKPYFVPCRTTHARFFPKKHSFSYSYLLVGIPVGCSANIDGMLSMDLGVGHPRAWYDVDAVDYLQRGSGHLGLRGKLDSYLISQVWQAVQVRYLEALYSLTDY